MRGWLASRNSPKHISDLTDLILTSTLCYRCYYHRIIEEESDTWNNWIISQITQLVNTSWTKILTQTIKSMFLTTMVYCFLSDYPYKQKSQKMGSDLLKNNKVIWKRLARAWGVVREGLPEEVTSEPKTEEQQRANTWSGCQTLGHFRTLWECKNM